MNRTILVTGVSRGLGLAVAETLLEAGDTVLGVSRTKSEAIGALEQRFPERMKFRAVIHPSAYVSSSCRIGRGVIVGPNVTIGPNVAIGDYTLLNARVSVGHDAQIGSCNIVSPNVAFTGFAKVGDDNFFGLNSAVLPRVSIGNGNTIAAGMIVDKDVGNGEVVFYRFKERIVAVAK
jgi:N-acetylglucosamine-1-phosphate uridyltransferase (contains nucleotidyltransferase and I-patch acetyltransferase domains)